MDMELKDNRSAGFAPDSYRDRRNLVAQPQSANTRQLMLLAIAAIFHIVGIIGIGITHSEAIRAATPFHMMLMGGLLILSFKDSLRRFLPWAAIIFIVCFAAEWIGVHYGWLFGGYRYGSTLGHKWQGIPIIIGVNWMLVAAGAISIGERLRLPQWLMIPAAATLATGYDWLLEPLAVRLGYWAWEGGRIPAYNYLCWWGLTALSAVLWSRFRLQGNLFARGLFLMQIVFFIALRALL